MSNLINKHTLPTCSFWLSSSSFSLSPRSSVSFFNWFGIQLKKTSPLKVRSVQISFLIAVKCFRVCNETSSHRRHLFPLLFFSFFSAGGQFWTKFAFFASTWTLYHPIESSSAFCFRRWRLKTFNLLLIRHLFIAFSGLVGLHCFSLSLSLFMNIILQQHPLVNLEQRLRIHYDGFCGQCRLLLCLSLSPSWSTCYLSQTSIPSNH